MGTRGHLISGRKRPDGVYRGLICYVAKFHISGESIDHNYAFRINMLAIYFVSLYDDSYVILPTHYKHASDGYTDLGHIFVPVYLDLQIILIVYSLQV